MKTRFVLAAIIAVLLDLIDYSIGWIPVAGDLLDIMGIIILLALIGKYAIISVVEFIPFIGDLLPAFTASVVLARMEEKKKAKAEAEAKI